MSEQTTIEPDGGRPMYTDASDVAAAKAEAKPKPVRDDSVYVVQALKRLPDGPEAEAVLGDFAGVSVWQDIATVTVPRKSPRKKVIGHALAQSGIRPTADSEPLRLRVLDAASARETEVKPFQPEAEWRL